MADYLATDEEQVAKLRSFWKEYGVSIIVGLILAMVVVFGWRFYRRYETTKAQQASLIYATMMSSAQEQQFQSATAAAHGLIQKFPKTAYADFAHLWLAKQAVATKHYQPALTALLQVQTHGHMPALRQIAALRRGEIYQQLNQPAKALAALKKTYDPAYLPKLAEIKGDAYHQMGNKTQALYWYQKAQKALDTLQLSSPILEMKLADIPTTTHTNHH
jgi:predicted negative regulator of RcsB-dependent stress response